MSHEAERGAEEVAAIVSAFHAYATHGGDCQLLLFPSTDERYRCTCGLAGWVRRVNAFSRLSAPPAPLPDVKYEAEKVMDPILRRWFAIDLDPIDVERNAENAAVDLAWKLEEAGLLNNSGSDNKEQTP